MSEIAVFQHEKTDDKKLDIVTTNGGSNPVLARDNLSHTHIQTPVDYRVRVYATLSY